MSVLVVNIREESTRYLIFTQQGEVKLLRLNILHVLDIITLSYLNK